MKIRYEMLLIAVGCVIYSLSMIMINPIELIPGSFLGLAVACHKVFGTPTGVVNLLLNIPIMLLCVKIFGKKMLYYTVIIMVGTSALIDLFSIWAPERMYMNPIVISILGGFVMGVGAGILLEAGGTMAGTTALARIINNKLPKISVGNSLIIMDTVIILTGCVLIHSFSALLYSLLYTLSCSKTIDIVMALARSRVIAGAHGYEK